jgi:long-chain fatty acid transport protein
MAALRSSGAGCRATPYLNVLGRREIMRTICSLPGCYPLPYLAEDTFRENEPALADDQFPRGLPVASLTRAGSTLTYLKRLAAGLAVAGASLAVDGDALGSGFQLRENSTAALGNAFAGAAVSTDDASIIANNPAGMTGLSGNLVSSDLSIVIPSEVFSGTTSNAVRQPIGGGNGGDAGGAQPVPSLYGFYDASPDVKLGLAVTFPFGLKTQYEPGWVGRYQAVKSELDIVDINPNIAYRVTDWLSIGGGPAIQHASAELTSAINSTTVAHLANPLLPAGLTLPDGYARVTGDSLSVGYNLGVLAQISPRTRVGASYRSQVSQRLEGPA